MTSFVSAVRNTAVAALVAAAVFASPAQAQSRLSLAERVAALEEKAGGQGAAQGNIELLNQIQALQSQLSALQGKNEELQHQIEELKRTSKSQYVDLDSRIGRLEGGGIPMSPGGSAVATPPTDQGLPDVQLGGQPAPSNPSVPASLPPGAADIDRQASAASNAAPAAAASAVSADPVAEKAAYDAAFTALKDGRYAESARRFQGFVEQYPQSDLAGNAYYWLGESYYAAENFRVAQDTFQALLTRYPTSQKASDALLKVGYCQYETKQWDQAESTLNDVVTRYPNTQAARLAQGRLRALKLEAKR